jgi:hypothetical protein
MLYPIELRVPKTPGLVSPTVEIQNLPHRHLETRAEPGVRAAIGSPPFDFQATISKSTQIGPIRLRHVDA